jgi:hypothetical protein
MKRLIIAISLLAAGLVTAYSQTPQAPSIRPKEGFVPNAETAVKIGEAVLLPVYGEETIRRERPFKATRQGDVWTVGGSLNCGAPQCVGGAAVVKISKLLEKFFPWHIIGRLKRFASIPDAAATAQARLFVP